jgi:hypothetical protein
MEELGVTVAKLLDLTCTTNLIDWRLGWLQPGPESGKGLVLAECVGLFGDLRRNPLWKGDLVTYVATRCRVLLSDLSKLPGCKPVSQAAQRRPEAAMNEGDLAIDEATDKDLL